MSVDCMDYLGGLAANLKFAEKPLAGLSPGSAGTSALSAVFLHVVFHRKLPHHMVNSRSQTVQRQQLHSY